MSSGVALGHDPPSRYSVIEPIHRSCATCAPGSMDLGSAYRSPNTTSARGPASVRGDVALDNGRCALESPRLRAPTGPRVALSHPRYAPRTDPLSDRARERAPVTPAGAIVCLSTGGRDNQIFRDGLAGLNTLQAKEDSCALSAQRRSSLFALRSQAAFDRSTRAGHAFITLSANYGRSPRAVHFLHPIEPDRRASLCPHPFLDRPSCHLTARRPPLRTLRFTSRIVRNVPTGVAADAAGLLRVR